MAGSERSVLAEKISCTWATTPEDGLKSRKTGSGCKGWLDVAVVVVSSDVSLAWLPALGHKFFITVLCLVIYQNRWVPKGCH